jgi:hypothetical protein
MEQLAMLVLDGNGKKLVGRSSKQPDIQAFLENVPIYMVIECVCCAQRQLDRT